MQPPCVCNGSRPLTIQANHLLNATKRESSWCPRLVQFKAGQGKIYSTPIFFGTKALSTFPSLQVFTKDYCRLSQTGITINMKNIQFPVATFTFQNLAFEVKVDQHNQQPLDDFLNENDISKFPKLLSSTQGKLHHQTSPPIPTKGFSPASTSCSTAWRPNFPVAPVTATVAGVAAAVARTASDQRMAIVTGGHTDVENLWKFHANLEIPKWRLISWEKSEKSEHVNMYLFPLKSRHLFQSSVKLMCQLPGSRLKRLAFPGSV